MNYLDVQREHEAWSQANPDKKLSLPAYAAMRDVSDGTKLRESAYQDGFLKQANSWVDRLFEPVGNDLATYVGKPLDNKFGTNSFADIAKATPRAVAEGLSWLTGGGEAVAAGRLASAGAKMLPKLANVGSLAGMGSAALQGAAANDSSPLVGGLMGAASLPLGDIGAGVGEDIAGRLITKGGKALALSPNSCN